MDDSDLLSVADYAARRGCHRSSVYLQIKQNRLPSNVTLVTVAKRKFIRVAPSDSATKNAPERLI
jgi:hypothetical protein